MQYYSFARLNRIQRKALRSQRVRDELLNALEMMAHNADNIDIAQIHHMYSARDFMFIESAAFAECMLSWLYRQNFGKTVAANPSENAKLFMRANAHLLNCLHTETYGIFANRRELIEVHREMYAIRQITKRLLFNIETNVS